MKTHFAKPFLTVIILTAIAVIYGCSGASPEYRTYENNLRDQMQEMIVVLNAGHSNEFMSTYADPSYIASKGGVNKALLEFGNKEQQQLIRDLKASKNITPLYNSKNKEMTYVSELMKVPVVFKLINNKWYLTGDWFRQ